MTEKTQSIPWRESARQEIAKYTEIKCNGTCWICRLFPFSLNLENAKKYLASQKEHHKRISFKEELLGMLQRAQAPYDEKYLWD